jgi:flagellar hook-basal body complex protein FliE
MTDPLRSVSPVLPVSPAGAGARAGSGFQNVLADAIRDVEAVGQNASAGVQRFLSGEGEELHETAMAAQRAEMAFELFLQARNKVVQAYQEIMRMPM